MIAGFLKNSEGEVLKYLLFRGKNINIDKLFMALGSFFAIVSFL